MDIGSLNMVARAEKGAPLEVLDPSTGATTGMVLYVLGGDATAVVDAANRLKRERLKAKDEDPIDALSRHKIAVAIASVTGWSGVEEDGKELEFTAKRLTDLFNDPGYLWLVQDVYDFGSKRAHFFTSASKD